MSAREGGRRRIARAALALGVVGALTITGCGSQGVYSLPLPGGANVGSHPNVFHLQFADVLDLVPHSAVKVDGADVGKVTKIAIGPDGWTADVTVEINRAVRVPRDVTAQIAQTNLLGERFVDISTGDATGPELTSGASVPVAKTRTVADTEQVLGVLSMILTNGGVAQVKPIVDELNAAIAGRSGNVRALIKNASAVIDGLNKQRADITRALDGVNELAARASAQTEQIKAILGELPAGIAVLRDQRPQIVAMLAQLDRLGQVGSDVLSKTNRDLITEIKALRPTLQALHASADDIVDSLSFILTYPFPDAGVDAIHGNSMNLAITVDTRLLNQLEALGVGAKDPKYLPPKYGPTPAVNAANPWVGGNKERYGWPTISLLPPSPRATPGPCVEPSGGPGGTTANPCPTRSPFAAGASGLTPPKVTPKPPSGGTR